MGLISALSASGMSFDDVSGTEVQVTLSAPNGNFDYLELELKLTSTDSNKYFVDPNKSRPNCAINSTITKSNLTPDIIKSPINLTGLCPLSYWNASIKTFRTGFTPTIQYDKYRNGNFKFNYTSVINGFISKKATITSTVRIQT